MATLLEMKKARLDKYYSAEEAILLNQSYTLNGRSVTRANLSEIRKGITMLEKEIKEMENGSGFTRRVIPMDI